MKTAFLLAALLIICFTSSAQDNEFHLNKTYKISPAGTIDLRSSDANIHITGSNRNDVHVKIDRVVEIDGLTWGDIDKNFDVEVKEQNGDLLIAERNEGSVTVMGSINEDYNIYIEAPIGVSLKLQGDDDDYIIQNINGSITLNADDGNAEFLNCGGKYFDFDLDDGDIKMDGAAGELRLNADDADIIIKNASFNIIEVDLDDADLLIETSLAANGKYEFNGDDSDFELVVISGGGKFDIRHDDGSVRSSKSFTVIEENEDRTILELGKGNAMIYFNTDDASIRLSAL
ncbi:MAG: DUF4097 family beta strand repeat-containing protein [Candidatus Cyclobacteriaceae bacterium M2_1C_046]